ncbi:hypothetical protein Acr_01g0007980 [Actinidia rufa]|uniref:Uncharacterized protein n=1 Tax=Actinidia rufa TaxID=165716 RepID=A0A7J0E4V8_9ERIC|nr:hypothetical protein Acr_01g0007980 [Actinidia rufa]
MANPGGVGTKFLSMNLNKSYGLVSHHQQPHGSGSYGQAAASRARPGSHGRGGGGGGGGMVVLSRPRSSHKVGSKLSVPPPLNLPSLRKEHERFDVSGSGGGSVGGGGSGSGSRPASSGLGWTRPGAVTLQEKDGNVAVFGRSGGEAQSVDGVNQSVGVLNKGSAAYMPPLVRSGEAGLPNSVPAPSVERTSVLRGEDFPSLRAALPSSASGPVQKQKDGSHQKQKNLASEEPSNEQTDSSLVHTRSQGQSYHPSFGNGLNKNGGDSHGLGSSQMVEQARKQDYFPGPLPLVILNPRLDWADDERDTGRGFAEQGRDNVFPRNEAYWDRKFDMPRNSVLPHKPSHNLFERRAKLEDEAGKVSSIEVLKVGPYSRDVRTPSREDREGNMWRTSPLQKNGLNAQEVAIGRNGIDVRPMAVNREVVKENKYIPPHFGDNSRDGVTGNREATFGRRDVGHGHEGRHQWNRMGESSSSRGIECNTQDRYVSEQSNRYRVDAFQDNSASKSLFSSGGKGFHINDPTLNFSREKRPFSKSERPYLDDPFLKEIGTTSFDEHDPFSGGFVGVIKRKKDVVKQADFHDPVREFFEAELERVQKMQEQERQRIIEEQERVLEQARREEEERLRLIREEQERRRRLEEEAREAAWRAEQERLEAFRRAEEQKIAREEEKQSILLEEERRKQAAKQKLLELEAKIAKRQFEEPKGDSSAGIVDEKVSAVVTERYIPRAVDLDYWEDSERMLERLTTSGSSDSSALNRPFELAPRSRPTREGSSGFLDKGKPANSWRRDVFEDVNSSPFLVQNQDNGHHSPRRDVSVGGRAVTRKEFHGGEAECHRGWRQLQQKHRDDDPEFHENVAERYGDVEWGLSRTRGNPHSPYPDRLYYEADELYSYGRSRYSMRQPRVLPPLSIASVHKTSFRGENEHPGPLTFLDINKHHNHASRSEPTMQNVYQHEESKMTVVDVQPENTMPQDQKPEKKITPRCASQSSLSVSSPPNSPTPLSHDDLDESGDSPVASAVTEGKNTLFSGNESVVLNIISGKDAVVTASSSISGADDEDWALENNEELQEQEEYEEDEDGYQEEDEVHEGDDEHLDLTQEFDDLDLEERGSRMMDNLVLGFDEGVEVGIPSDEFERSPRNLESSFGIPEDAKGWASSTSGQFSPTHREFPGIQETEKAIQDSAAQPINTCSYSPTCEPLDMWMLLMFGCVQLAVPSSFGLFSGPSLIPSPVPAIQIGSYRSSPPTSPSWFFPHSYLPTTASTFPVWSAQVYISYLQGILPVAPQSVSFIQSNVQAYHNLNQSSGGPLPILPGQDSSTHNLIKDDVPSVLMDRECTESNALIHNQAENAGQNKVMSERDSRAEDKRNQDTVVKDYIPSSNGSVSEGHLQTAPLSSQSIWTEKDFRGSKAEGPLSGNRGKKIAYPARNPDLRSSFPTSEASRSDSRGFQRRPRRTIQRTEFRVRENVDWRQSPGLGSSNSPRQVDKSNFTGREVGYFVKSGSKKGWVGQKPLKQIVEHECSSSDQSAGEANLTRNMYSEEDVDSPLQSGIVCVFNQPGIEATSDGHDFIEVRSKRQMLNDRRREQREKEIKAKSRVTKGPRKPQSLEQDAVVSTSSNRTSASLDGEAPNKIHSNIEAPEGHLSDRNPGIPVDKVGSSEAGSDLSSGLRADRLETGPFHPAASGQRRVLYRLGFGSDSVMANPGGVGTKFLSMNLNKSYGLVSHHQQPHGSGSYGQAAASRARPGSHGRGGGGGGGGMVVLSRPRSGGSVGGGGSGSGSRPASSGLGWTRPGAVTLQEKDGNVAVFGRSGGEAQSVDGVNQSVGVLNKGSAAYMPPLVRSGEAGLPNSVPAPSVERTSVLRGEDFPSLRAALPSSASGPVQKQKDGSHQKQKNLASEEPSNEQTDSSLVHTRSQGQSYHPSFGNGLNKNGGDSHGLGSSQMVEQARKQDYFPGPLPLVILTDPRLDWADDERDTGRGFAEQGRDNVFPRNEAYWDRKFDMPRNSVLPHKPSHNLFERRAKLEDEAGKVSSIEVLKVGPYSRDVRTPSREDREEVVKENKYIPPHFGDNSRDGVTGNREATFGRRDVGHGHEGRHQWNRMGESSSSRGIECNTQDRYVSEQSNRYRVDAFQDNSASKSLFSSGGKGFHINDPTLNFSREKRPFSKSERPYLDDPFLKEIGTTSFDEHDPFSGGFVGVIKRKKDVVKQADFHDPVREFFEAELERVQKMQEQERQRIIEEQERVLEQARREEEERLRLIREEQERRRRLEEEAREAAWRAEQERLEAFRRAEEQKIAREEEKQSILLEEERRKQAAKQKLLELEAKIAKRQFEEPKGDSSAGIVDEKVSAVVTERYIPRAVDLDYWEDSERMLERLTTSGSSDSSALNRPFELAPRSRPTREGSSGFLDKGKPANSWRRDVFEDVNSSPFLVQNQDNGHHSPRRDVSVGGRAVTRKEFHGGGGYMSSRTHFRGGMQEHDMEDFTPLKGQRRSATGDGDSFSRNTEMDPEFHENVAERYGDVEWGLSRTRGNPHSPYPDRLYYEADELYSYGRSRYSMRQPRVLPPLSIASVHKTSFRGENEHPGPLTFLDINKHHNHASRSEPTMQNVYQHEESKMTVVDVQPENTMPQDQKPEKKITPRCASQSSLSVSSPPNSPTPLSHDDLDESGDSPVASAVTEGKNTLFSGNESVVLNIISGKDAVVTASSSISGADDEDWALENNEELQEQEEYEEDEDGYQEEDEVHEGDDEHLDLTQEFDDLDLEERGSRMMDNLVLGFDEGVEVGIPSDEFERSPRNLESSFGIPEVSFGTIEEQGPVDRMQRDGHCLQPLDSSPRMRIESSSRRIQETEKAIQDSAAQPINTAAHTSPTCEPLDSVDASNSSGVCAQLAVPSSVNMTLHSSSQTVMSTLPVAPSQPDLPVKLQFGLFSGPSLIPSPVPAIQIGSIQMPLHLHPPVGSSLTHICPPQPPLFQFGQLRYTSPISQGILPVAPQSVSFIQSNVQAYHNLNQSSGGPLPILPGQDSSTHNLIKDDVPSVLMDRECTESNALIHNQAENAGQNKVMSERDSRAEDKRNQDTVVKDYIPSSNGSVSEGHLQTAPLSSQSIWTEKDFRGSKAEGPLSGNRGKKIAYPARNPDLRSSFPTSEASRSDSRGFQRRPRRTIQRTEFRVRENVDWRQSPGLGSSNSPRQVDKSNFTGREVGYFVKSGSKKGWVGQKPLKQIVEHECSSSDQVSYQGTDSGVRLDKRIEKEASTRTQSAGEANLTRNMYSEEDVDSPLQSGIVCVFNQPGIEATSDGHDFIEVRSKRQMLNDRREQREKEIKAKSRVTKGPRKPQSLEQDAVVSTSSNRTSASLDGEAPNKIHSNIEAPEGWVLVNREVSTGFATMVSQTLAPIGTPVAANYDTQADKRPHNVKSLQKAPTSVISNCGKNLGPSLMFETKSKILDNVQTSLGTWGNAQINQQECTVVCLDVHRATLRQGCPTLAVSCFGGFPSKMITSIKIWAPTALLSHSDQPQTLILVLYCTIAWCN